EEQAAPRPVPQPERELPVELVDDADLLVLVEVDDDLGVGARTNGVAIVETKALARLGGGVELGVERDRDRAGLVGHRLGGGPAGGRRSRGAGGRGSPARRRSARGRRRQARGGRGCRASSRCARGPARRWRDRRYPQSCTGRRFRTCVSEPYTESAGRRNR